MGRNSGMYDSERQWCVVTWFCNNSFTNTQTFLTFCESVMLDGKHALIFIFFQML